MRIAARTQRLIVLPEPPEPPGEDASARAEVRDVAAAVRDAAADRRDLVLDDSPGRAADDRASATSDRTASAEDRRLSATDRKVSAIELRSAYRDGLTGALLRDAGRDQLEKTLDRARRSPLPLVLAFLDVDHLKAVNDAEGHAAGDKVLAAVGAALGSLLRSYDVVVRWGGDEFVCALPDCSEGEAQQRFAEVADLLADVTGVSVGIVIVSAGEGLDPALARADSAMYATRAS
jgi:diguanylate cyclase (GGDEF)-like protein